MQFTDESLEMDIAGKRWPMFLRSPQTPAANPALIINLGNTGDGMLSKKPYHFVIDPFVEAGHYAASFHLPFEGSLADSFGKGLEGFAAAHVAGLDPHVDMVKMSKAVIDLIVGRGLVREDRIYVGGTSRGGLAAFHVTASDPRVQACAAVAPVTHLPALREWHGKEHLPVVQRSSAMALAPRLTDRPLYVIINRVDARVDTQQCLAFVEAVKAAGGSVELHLLDAEGHGLIESAYGDSGKWLLERARG